MPGGDEITFINLSDDDGDLVTASKSTQLLTPEASNGNNAENNNFPKPLPTLAARKQLVPSSWDANELSKPLSPYARFFQDTASTIKQQNPNCTYNEVRQIVLNMWEALDDERKKAYLENKDNCNPYMKKSNASNANQNTATAKPTAKPTAKATAAGSNDGQPTGSSSNITKEGSSPEVDAPQTNANTANKGNLYKPKFTASSHAESNANDNKQKHQTCIRVGCNNPAIVSPDWEDEYCSNACVVLHCRNVFSSWAAECKKEHEARGSV